MQESEGPFVLKVAKVWPPILLVHLRLDLDNPGGLNINTQRPTLTVQLDAVRQIVWRQGISRTMYPKYINKAESRTVRCPGQSLSRSAVTVVPPRQCEQYSSSIDRIVSTRQCIDTEIESRGHMNQFWIANLATCSSI